MKTQYLLLIYFIFLFCPGCSLDENTKNDNEGIHSREGLLNIGDSTREYKFKDVPADVGFVTSFPWEAIHERVPNDIIDSIDIQYWIYKSVEDAELAIVECLDLSNLYMHNIIDLPLPQGQIGDNCWHQLSVCLLHSFLNKSI